MKLICLIIILVSFLQTIEAQDVKVYHELNKDESSQSKSFIARDYITLKTGFKFISQNPEKRSFSAKIGNFPTLYQPNTAPGNVTSSNNTGEPPAGSSYSSPTSEHYPGLTSYQNIKTAVDSTRSVKSLIFPVMWFQTSPVTNNLNGLYHWHDIGGQNSIVNQINGNGIKTEFKAGRDKISSYNFNPAIDLSYDSLRKEIINRKSDLNQHTIIGVFGEYAGYNLNKFMFAVYGKQNQAVLFSKDHLISVENLKRDSLVFDPIQPGFMLKTSTVQEQIKFAETTLKIGTFYKSGQPDFDLWGKNDTSVFMLGSDFQRKTMQDSVFSKYDENLKRFKGYSPELLVFDYQLSVQDSRKFETYLAVKYGITLNNHYVSSCGKELWNMNTENTYHNRVFAFGRDDGYGLNQYVSTTSNEESPNFTNLKANESYFQADSYLSSSAKRLLVVGQEKGSNLIHEDYTIIGDNNDSLICDHQIEISTNQSIEIFRRKWLIRKTVPDAFSEISWDKSPQLTLNTLSQNCYNLYAPLNSARQHISSIQPLSGSNACVAWKSANTVGPLLIKFGSASDTVKSNSADCGYFISRSGQVYPVVDGNEGFNSVFTIQPGQKIEIEKWGETLFMRVNGIRYQCTELSVSKDESTPTHITLALPPSSAPTELNELRFGGINDTGNFIELSYGGNFSSFFSENQQPCLIIDESGESTFANPQIIQVSEIDSVRQKYIYRNIIFDNDADRKTYFSFGYLYQGPGHVKKENPDQGGSPQDDENQQDILSVYYRDLNDLSNITVKTQTSSLNPVYISLFDISGRRVNYIELPPGMETRFTDLNLPEKGIYIVSVTTGKSRLNQKVISK